MGILSRKWPQGSEIGDKLIWHSGVSIHDFHAWNYLGGLLIDMTAFASIEADNVGGFSASWGKSDDHIYIYPPHGVEYIGVQHEDADGFLSELKKYLVLAA